MFPLFPNKSVCRVICVMTLLFLSATSQAVTIDTSQVIDATNSFPDEIVVVIDGANPPTVIDFNSGGTVLGMQLFGSSVINLSGGFVINFLETYENS